MVDNALRESRVPYRIRIGGASRAPLPRGPMPLGVQVEAPPPEVEMDPETFHFTDHYRDHPIVLARIASVDPTWLRAALERRWRRVAPRRIVTAFDAA